MKVRRHPQARGCKRTVFLKDEERFRLIHGPYEPPLFKNGVLFDAVRGWVEFAKYSNGRIPWPKFRKQGPRGSGGFVLCGDLLRALEQESTPAICYHWDVCAGTVLQWRRALGLKGRMSPGAQRMVDIGVDLCKRPESQAKLVASAETREMSAEGREAIRQSVLQRLERKHAARLAYYQRTGKFRRAGPSDPWLPQEEKLLKKHSTRELMAILGRTWEAIQSHRRKLNIRLRPTNTPWSETELKLLGTDTDAAIAQRLHRTVAAVKTKRKTLRIRACRLDPSLA
jgi:hypothetical protein